MKNCLVTGGAGFIGSHLVDELLRSGKKVRVLDNFLTGRKENLAPSAADIDLVEGDIRDPETCLQACRGMDAVLHQAALPSVPRSLEDPSPSNAINVTGTLNMLEAARKAGVRRFVFASSSTVYGDDTGLPKREGKEGNPLSPYAVTKQAGEKYCRVHYQVFGLETVCLRYFNIFGPRQNPHSPYAAVIPRFILKLTAGQPPVIYGDGEQTRDFTYVANAVQANLLALEAEGAPGGIFNIACGQRISVNALADRLMSLLGLDLAPKHEAPRAGDIKHSFADVSLAERVLGFRPQFGFEEGLEATVLWFRERGEG